MNKIIKIVMIFFVSLLYFNLSIVISSWVVNLFSPEFLVMTSNQYFLFQFIESILIFILIALFGVLISFIENKYFSEKEKRANSVIFLFTIITVFLGYLFKSGIWNIGIGFNVEDASLIINFILAILIIMILFPGNVIVLKRRESIYKRLFGK